MATAPINSILALAQKLSTDRKVVRIKSQKVGDKTLSVDGEDTIRRVLVDAVVKKRTDLPTGIAVAVMRTLATADLVAVAQRYGIDPKTAELRQAEGLRDLADILTQQGRDHSSESIDALRSECADLIRVALKTPGESGKCPSAVTLMGTPNTLQVLALADLADCDRLAAAMPGAAERVAKAEAEKAAQQAEKAAKQAEAADRKAKLAARGPAGVKPSALKALAAMWVAQAA